MFSVSKEKWRAKRREREEKDSVVSRALRRWKICYFESPAYMTTAMDDDALLHIYHEKCQRKKLRN